MLVVRARYEKKVATQLEKWGIVCYLPLKRELRQWHDRKKWVESPLFSSYLFVQPTVAQLHQVFETSGTLQYLRYDNKPALVSELEIKRIKEICAFSAAVLVEPSSFHPGERVEIQEGPFIGYQGILVEKTGQQYLKIAIKSMALQMLLQIDAGKVKKVKSLK